MRGYVEMEGKIRPSAVLAIDEIVSVEGKGFQSGVLRSSTSTARAEIGGRLEMSGWNMVDFSLNMPEGEMMKISSFSK